MNASRGMAVWVPSLADASGNTQAWDSAEVLQQDTEMCRCITADNREVSVPLKSVEMRELLPDDGVDDLTSLSYLHEPAILDNLMVRASTTNPRKAKHYWVGAGV